MATKKTRPQKSGSLDRRQAFEIIYLRPDLVQGQRFTQDTPVTPDVWLLYATEPGKAHELLLTPDRDSTVEQLVRALRISLERLGEPEPRVIYNQSHALARLTLEQLILAVLPISAWWLRELGADPEKVLFQIPLLLKEQDQLADLLMNPAEIRRRGPSGGSYSESLLHMVRIAGSLLMGKPIPNGGPARRRYFTEAIKNLEKLFLRLDLRGLWMELDEKVARPRHAPLWNVFPNRTAESAIYKSRQTVKADAATQLFNISCAGLRWAVVDSGIDARHPAFGGDPDPARSRVERTYDFTVLRELLYSGFDDSDALAKTLREANLPPKQWPAIQKELRSRLASGRFFDWDLLEKVLRVDHGKDVYRPPENQHGTHVAGIIAADGRRRSTPGEVQPEDEFSAPPEVTGICPDLQLYDLRVFDEDGAGDEFSILAALQFIRHMNANRDTVTIHGVNMSFSLKHLADSYACGATPVCEECSRLTGAGVVVVAAAGNRGYRTDDGDGFGNYNDISITDPVNAEDAITVGSTHRHMPHKYGVSYFSSRGPTGDGRSKPDLLAPGEKIVSTIPGGKTAVLDGTSMAAPHVSGAAALLMARHKELIGQPRRIKDILCKTATDLDRDRTFQGAGLLDILRALQSV